MALAPFAMDVTQSRGRRWPEPAHPYRNDYARDRDRVIHSRAFRRLEAKTQVFTTRYSDHFRNRLTHTLEVAQIARTVAGALDLNVDLAEALALVHDIGHSPFGHAGERRLDKLMRAYGDRFDHNLHALHIVEQFEHRYLDFPGLNLTFEVREGIVKHSRDYAPAAFPELAEYLLDLRPPLEAQLMDAVDEIAYGAADLDDGFESLLITPEEARAEVPLFAEIYADVERSHPDGREALKIVATIKRLLDGFATDLFESSRAQILASGVTSVSDVRSAPRRMIGLSATMAAHSATLKKFLARRLYAHPGIVEEREPCLDALDELFAYYMEHPETMPEYFAAQADQSPRHRVVCDYIAGMTDHFLLRQHRELLGPAARAVSIVTDPQR